MSTTDDSAELLACPFCGGLNLQSGGDDKFVGVRCLNCEATGPNHYITGREWNTRAADAGVREALVRAINLARKWPLKDAGVLADKIIATTPAQSPADTTEGE